MLKESGQKYSQSIEMYLLKEIRVLRRRRLEDRADGLLGRHAIPEDPHIHHIERDQIEGLLGQYAIPEDPHIHHIERDQTEGLPDGMLALPDDPLIENFTTQPHALPFDQHQLVDLHEVPVHTINGNN
ncbi:hypothetical protein HOLleu_18298 [Holothuria leucospilota]|uniref:Uncharacterized protein n=1 Tax=Holothuria leucospilota TaxID=206669 RepID=A0A9Q1C3F5_HOLLE|nr:hypothetical protein HOLleu_18298 [Holothuria leucospilota]